MTPEDVLTKIENIQKEINRLSDIIDTKLVDFYATETSEDWSEVDKKLKALVGDERKQIKELNRIIRSIQPVTLLPLDDIGDLMTLKQFVDCVNDGGFIDYDGHGYYAYEDKESNILVLPSDIIHGIVRNEFTHVMWYNR